jgi:transposase
VPSPTPDPLATLRAAASGLAEQGRTEDVLQLLLGAVASLQRDNDRLAARLTELLRGRSRGGSEKLSPDQLELFAAQSEEAAAELAAEDEALDELLGQDEGDDDVDDATPTRKRRPRRKPLPEDLPRTVVEHDVAEQDKPCPACGADRVCIGHDISEALDFVPAQLRVIEHRMAKYACKACDQEGRPGQLATAPAPPRPLDGGIPTSELLAEVLLRKYLEHMPINRLVEAWLQFGVQVPRSTVYGWALRAARLLQPLARRIHAVALASHLLQVDDTGVVVLDRSVEGGSKRGHLWSCLGDGRWAAYQYTPDWKADGPQAFLAGRVGWMQADGYAGFDRLYEPAGGTAVEVGCWAHARRYFVKAKDAGDVRAARPIKLIQRLFRIEREADRKGMTHEQRRQLRARKSKVLLEHLAEWVKAASPRAPPDEPLGRAITYLSNQWVALKRFLEDGRLPLTNNDCERSLRHIAVGRANWIFCGSDDGAEATAVLLTCLVSAKLHGVNVRRWLVQTLDRLGGGWPNARLDELLPGAEQAGEQRRAE